MADQAAVLSQGVGYGIVVGVGFAFAIGMVATTAALRRYQREKIGSEEFATAGRSVKTGLIASAVVSSWTWAATLLQSTTQAYKNGVSGPLWYAGGAMVQIVLFATVAIELKRKAPFAHTYLEVVKQRFGKVAHGIYMFFAVVTNILVTAMLLAGGSATVTDLTGMHPVAAMFLLPLGVTIYTLFGGLKATFLTDYVHTVILFVIIFLFVFTAYCTNEYIGSPGKLWELLTELAVNTPVEGNKDGSYLTMQSKSGAIFLVINLAGNFGTVFLDNGYWNKAIAASPDAALPGYILGGLSWFAIPWLTATTMGLCGLVLENTPLWPTYPLKMTDAQVSAGLTLPNTAVALLGKGGGVAALIMVFMAVTSASSAEMVAVSSIFTYDIYKAYINPKATGRQLIWVTHAAVVGFILILICVSIGLHYGGVSMGFLYLMMGVIISSAVLPACLTIFWSKLNKWSVCLSPTLGTSFGIIAWLVTCKCMYGEITVDTAGSDYPMLAGNVVSLCSPLLIVAVCQLAGSQNFDWELLKQIKGPKTEDTDFSEADISSEEEVVVAEDNSNINKHAKFARYFSIFTLLVFVVLWPMPMYGTGYVFSKKFFSGWIVVAIIWLFFSLGCVGFLPLWEGRHGIFVTFRGVYWDLTGQSYKLRNWQTQEEEKGEVETQPNVLMGQALREETPELKKD